jgi:hypothetical protein
VALDVVFRPQAEDEALEVRQWYESRRPGLGREFGQALDVLIARIAASPFAFPRVHNETRRAVLSRFPMPSISVSPKKRSSCWRFMAGNIHLAGDGAHSGAWFLNDTRSNTRCTRRRPVRSCAAAGERQSFGRQNRNGTTKVDARTEVGRPRRRQLVRL